MLRIRETQTTATATIPPPIYTPSAHPTNGYLIEFEIRPKSEAL